ncbi:putative quinol monooxygenase [Mucilaginibacter phyllosphaerae]|uniref:Quinol monooxygenase YgiN n=1 Tax=Mucilaginibacter phyllosphaerae TaxID=1812349 RepID=A0A4Y8AD51_9SPHI|nr:antibiotic biosynthesis monooxygenase [Mucilaginibacter phyllosphaerae]MBB3969230.1 quinol monooxygenase YgiN [Mucilaginibacter phyllosphaerae]TEW65969.1 hypothetical protein E2R65_12635 [Mucilaginibacter phyllosphaerae]GGH07125.1 hypothetical protein GCM10007352_11690 [Mucilaginibacter phyllosphaerae]
MKNGKVITHVEFTVRTEMINIVLQKAEITQSLILKEEGCETFILTTKKEASNVIVLFAVYTSEEIYQWHLEQEYVKNFFAYLADKLLAAPKVDYLVEY